MKMQHIMEKTIDMDGVNRLIVNTTSSDVELIQTEETVLKVQVWAAQKEEGNEPVELEIDRKNDALEIRIVRRRQDWLTSLKALGSWNVNVVFELPTRLYNEIVVDGSSSDLSVRQLLTNRLRASCHSGDIELETCAVNQELNLSTSSGDINVRDTLIKGDLTTQATSGDIRLNQLTADEMKIQTHSGDITVNDFRGDLDASASSGDIELNSDKLAGNVKLESSSGDVTVSFREEPDSFTMEYRGSSGDGSVHIKDMLYEEKSDHQIIGKKGDGRYNVRVQTSSGDFKFR
jgi:lia operon protein LiaG